MVVTTRRESLSEPLSDPAEPDGLAAPEELPAHPASKTPARQTASRAAAIVWNFFITLLKPPRQRKLPSAKMSGRSSKRSCREFAT